MKLRNKGFVIIGLLWIVFLALNHFSAIRQSLINFLALGSLFAISMWWLAQTFIIKRVEQLNKQLKEISTKNSELLPIHMTGDDEIALMTQQINNLYISSHSSYSQPEEKQIPVKSDNKEPLTWLTHYNKITSLPNHIFFNETLNKAISHAKRRNKLLAVLLIDVSPVNIETPTSELPINDTLFNEIEKKTFQHITQRRHTS